MGDLIREFGFSLKEKVVKWTLLIAFVLSSISIYNGILAIDHQKIQIEELRTETKEDQTFVLPDQSDPGSAAYYIFHITYDPPSALAHIALGMRDELPWKHRIRMLALEGQIYENDPGNPELTHLGKLDFVYLLSIILPLLLVGLLYDLDARERRESRLELLQASSKRGPGVLHFRAIARSLLLLIAILLPFLISLLFVDASLSDSSSVVLAALFHVAFWLIICRFVNRNNIEGVHSAAILFGLWLLFTSIIPVAGKLFSEKSIAVPGGGQILLTQRETVNDAWDLPKEDTMTRFVDTHPEWSKKTEILEPFEWKWYYAFQQVGDQEAASLSSALNEGIVNRDNFMSTVSAFSPPLLVDRWLTRKARTDVTQHLHYLDCVRGFHKELRNFHYQMMFGDEEFSDDRMKQLPQFAPCKADS